MSFGGTKTTASSAFRKHANAGVTKGAETGVLHHVVANGVRDSVRVDAGVLGTGTVKIQMHQRRQWRYTHGTLYSISPREPRPQCPYVSSCCLVSIVSIHISI